MLRCMRIFEQMVPTPFFARIWHRHSHRNSHRHRQIDRTHARTHVRTHMQTPVAQQHQERVVDRQFVPASLALASHAHTPRTRYCLHLPAHWTHISLRPCLHRRQPSLGRGPCQCMLGDHVHMAACRQRLLAQSKSSYMRACVRTLTRLRESETEIQRNTERKSTCVCVVRVRQRLLGHRTAPVSPLRISVARELDRLCFVCPRTAIIHEPPTTAMYGTRDLWPSKMHPKKLERMQARCTDIYHSRHARTDDSHLPRQESGLYSQPSAHRRAHLALLACAGLRQEVR